MWLSARSLFALVLCGFSVTNGDEFPPNFLFGASSAAYQVEGAWNTSDKGESIWDHLIHMRPELVLGGTNADTAADSYHKYKEDIQLLKSINGKVYRFSMSWPRILPDGFNNRISVDGVRYYNDLINECLANGITPFVTIYHWDLPQRLQDLGGWTNPLIIEWITDYSDVVFSLFGDRVKIWTTMNEPISICLLAYSDGLAPGIIQSGIADYLCGHHLLLAHASIAKLYHRKYQHKHNGKIGIVNNFIWFVPTDYKSNADIEAARRAFEFYNGWFMNPLFTPEGDYPKTMKDRILEKSLEQGFKKSRLPKFTRRQIKYLRNCTDFIGVNFYTASSVKDWSYGTMSFTDDAGYKGISDNLWEGKLSVEDTTRAFDELLETVHKKYRLPEIYITENGYASSKKLCDKGRIKYLRDNLQQLLKAMKDGVNVHGYMIWSLIDDFEWIDGYESPLGLFHVDFNDPDKPRTAKLSASFISEVYRTGSIPDISKFVCEDRQA